MKLSLPEIREESFEVKTSIKNIKKMHAYQLELAKSQEKLASVQDGTLEELTKANDLLNPIMEKYDYDKLPKKN